MALSFALNDRYRREFVLQQLVRVVTVERVKSEQEANPIPNRNPNPNPNPNPNSYVCT